MPRLHYPVVTTDQHLAAVASPGQDPVISVILPTFRGAGRITRALDSVAAQTLRSTEHETLVIVNGDDDETADVVRRWTRENPEIAVRLIQTRTPGAGNARNLGVGAARGTYCTFLDDDDWLSPTFLADLLAQAKPGVVVVGRINDVVGAVDSFADPRNYFNHQVVRWAGTTATFSSVPTAAAANAAKLVETRLALDAPFDTSLNSGEDVVFWCDIMTRGELALRFVDIDTHAVYYRWSRDDSISRRDASFEFNVLERLEVIERLLRLRDSRPSHAVALSSVARAQVNHVNKYLGQFPEQRDAVLDEIRTRRIRGFPYSALNKGLAKDLVVAYAFPPTNDTSGIVVARRVRERGRPVDVISSGLTTLRSADPSTTVIAEEHVARHTVVPGDSTFGSWPLIEEFCVRGRAEIAKFKTSYERIYSRSMWPAAHILAASYKLENPDVTWIAEFSDPLLYDSRGERRTGTVDPDSELVREFRRELLERGIDPPRDDNLFAWIELLVYALADEIHFTNPNQLEYMMGYLEDASLRASIRERSKIDPHPTLPSEYYSIASSTYETDRSKINIGYFGVFYAVRGVGDILDALETLTMDARKHFCLHIFTDKPQKTRRTVHAREMDENVKVQPYVPYLAFLNLTTKLDWLLVCDARTSESHGMNPYLPSKLSDYQGSGTPIWAIVEDSSVLSEREVHAKSRLGDVEGAAHVLKTMLQLRGFDQTAESSSGS